MIPNFQARMVALCLWPLVPGSALAQAATAPSLPPPSLGSTTKGVDAATYTMVSQTATRLAEGLRACSGRKLSDDRLHCYDALTGTLPMVDMPSGKGIGAWVVGVGYAGVAATQTTSSAEDAETASPSLFVKCRSGQLEAYVTYGTPIMAKDAQKADVQVRFDDLDAPVSTRDWLPSQSGKAVGLWTTGDALPLVQRMTQASRVNVRVTMQNDKLSIATFEIKGGDAALTPLLAACHVK